LVYLTFRSSKNNYYFSFFLGSIPLEPSLMQSLEDGQALIDLLPNSNTVDVFLPNCYKWKAMEISDRRKKYFFKRMVHVEYVAFIQLDKCG